MQQRSAGGRRFWVVPFGRDEVRLDLDYPWYDSRATRPDRAESRALLDAMIDQAFGGVGKQSWLEGVLLEVHDELAGDRFRLGSSGEETAAVRGVLARAVDSGQLVVTRQPLRLPPLPPQPPRPGGDVLGPEPRAAPETTWFSVRVLDEVGDPVDGIGMAYSIGGRRRVVTTNGAGVAILSGVDAGAASAGVASVAAARDKLKPRWREPRDPSIPDGDDVTVWNVADLEGASLSLAPKKTATLVLTPYFECREVPGAHFDFGRSFVRSSALEVLAPIAEALSSDGGRKALVFGHTDLAGPAALNKELSERRAKALFALLTHDSDAWEELFSGSADGPHWKEKWDLEEVQHMLNALGCTDDGGRPLEEDGIRGRKTLEAIHRFQAGRYPDRPAEQAALPPSDDLGVAGRKELFLAYAKRVARKPVDRARISKFGEASFMGCGEFNPVGLTVKDAESRRAVIFLFDPAAEPQDLPCRLRSTRPCEDHCGPIPTRPDPGGRPPYRCEIYRRVAEKCPCQAGQGLSHNLILRFPIAVEDADLLPHVYALESDDATIHRKTKLAFDARAGASKRAELSMPHLPETHLYELSCDEGDGGYTVFDYIKLSQLQARAAGGAASVVGDEADLHAYWAAHQDDPPTDADGETDGGRAGDAPPGDTSAGADA